MLNLGALKMELKLGTWATVVVSSSEQERINVFNIFDSHG